MLRKGRTASIGLVLEDLADPFYGPLNRAVEEVARAHGALLINGSSAEDPDREQELVLALCARRVDGLIVIPAGDDHRYLEPEIKAGVATVFVDRPAGQIDADVVLSDSFGGARAGVAHLIAHGHRRIGFIGDQPRIHTAVRAAARLPHRDGRRRAGDPRRLGARWAPPARERVRAAVASMLAGPEPVTAIFTGNNRVTVTAVRVLAAHERPVALVGFDDIELADLLKPGVTVIAQDAATLGRTAAERLFRRLDGAGRRPVTGGAADPSDRPRLGRDPAVRGPVGAVTGTELRDPRPHTARRRPGDRMRVRISPGLPSPGAPTPSSRERRRAPSRRARRSGVGRRAAPGPPGRRGSARSGR